MSESQSRYSIVERLTKSKLDLMTQKHDVEDSIANAKQSWDMLKESEKDDEIHLEDISKIEIDNSKKFVIAAKKKLKFKVAKEKQSYENLNSRKKDKNNLFDEKIATIDKALTQLKEISETSSS